MNGVLAGAFGEELREKFQEIDFFRAITRGAVTAIVIWEPLPGFPVWGWEGSDGDVADGAEGAVEFGVGGEGGGEESLFFSQENTQRE